MDRDGAVAYQALGREYYLRDCNRTCQSLRAASKALLQEQLGAVNLEEPGLLLETGAGNSLLAELLSEGGNSLERLLITDGSQAMLQWSEPWAVRGARLQLASAAELPVDDASVSLLVSALADPYNTLEFWQEAKRVLQAQGTVLFTTPAYQWVTAYRPRDKHSAVFTMRDHSQVSVPSWVYPIIDQEALIAEAGLRCQKVTHYLRQDIETNSEKFANLEPQEAIVSCYLARL